MKNACLFRDYDYFCKLRGKNFKIQNMKKLLLVAIGALVMAGVSAQTPGYHKFTDTKTVTTAVNDQSRGIAAWNSALALFESDLLRQGKGTYDLSPMWIARWVYFEKVWKYVRMRGTINLSAGGTWEDVPTVVRKYGIVPAEVYAGVTYNTAPDYNVLNGVAKGYADAVISGQMRLNAFLEGLNSILDAYFGRVPETFTYGGVRYTPESFRNMLGLNMDDYVCITSFTHHPFYTWFAIEIPDNWAWGQAYNLPQQSMLDITVGALDKGYAVWWGADASDPQDVAMRGVALNSTAPASGMTGAELAKWVSVDNNQRAAMITRMTENQISPREYTQAERQLAFDSYETSDDHGMLLTGLAVDQDGGQYLKAKNAQSDDESYQGYDYWSFARFKYKTLEVAMHKDALPRELRTRLGYTR